MKNSIVIVVLLLISSIAYSQSKPQLQQGEKIDRDPSTWVMQTDKRVVEPKLLHRPSSSDDQQLYLTPRQFAPTTLSIERDPITGQVISVHGTIPGVAKSANAEQAVMDYIDYSKDILQLKSADESIEILQSQKDKLGMTNVRLQQHHRGYKIIGAEAIAHVKDGKVINLSGRLVPELEKVNLKVSINKTQVEEVLKVDLPMYKILGTDELQFIPQEQIVSELVIHAEADGSYSLDYLVSVYPTIADRYEYIIDAHTGEIKSKHSTLCKLHNHDHDHGVHEELVLDGEVAASGTDLLGQTRSFNAFNCGSSFFMVDASQSMYTGNDNCSDSDGLLQGVILTLDAKGTAPQNDNFDYDFASSGSTTSWNNPSAVSAHYNGLKAYDYFLNTHGRESINGNKGNIVSFVNVRDDDGSNMDNAFWNGSAIFYGNGAQAFDPLAASLDVAGHEMAHGVIQTTANLRYQGESGAMNEAFADIFGSMIDRDDWLIGEDIARTSAFPSGALRSMSDPHNGGNSLNDPGYQPRTVAEMFTGSSDNGGVHINSGIINYAYYLFVTQNSNVTKDIAERVFYRALTTYLISSSQFVDLRIAVINASNDLYGTAVANAAASAFSAVGIGGGGQTTTEPEDLEENTGTDFVYYSDDALSNINNATNSGADGGNFSTTDHLSKPSISDDGSIMLFVGTDNKIYEVDIDWSTGEILREFVLADNPIFRNVVTSKDGNRLAALTTDNDNKIFVFDFTLEEWQTFELFNPTYTAGVTTGDVQYADVLEFDFSGDNIVYDAFNEVTATTGEDISYWDIGIMNIWDNGDWASEEDNIFKLFSGLPEDVSVGNPSFAKNSPSIIALDIIDSRPAETEYVVFAINLETNDQGVIFEGNKLGYPNYSVDDSKMIFSFDNSGTDPIVAVINLNADKLTPSGDPTIFLTDARWAVWFATGTRDLSTALRDIPLSAEELIIAPNPANTNLLIYLPESAKGAIGVEVFDVLGRKVYQESPRLRSDQVDLDVNGYTDGNYIVVLSSKTAVWTEPVVVKH